MAYGCAGSSPAFRTISEGNNDAKLLFPSSTSMSDTTMADGSEGAVKSRRSFLRFLGVSSAGVAVVSAAKAVKNKTKDGLDVSRAEIDKLKEDYERLDAKTQLILKALLALTGLDIFMSL